MKEYAQPKLYSSKCLGFSACWWNGTMIRSDFIDGVKPFVEFVNHCPEVEIGLGVPRKWVRIVMKDDNKSFQQPATGKDLTKEMQEYIDEVVPTLTGLDGFVLRDRSPSCSIARIKYYGGPEKGADVLDYGPGFFGEAILHTYDGIPIESDGRLKDPKLREFFLSKIFTLADLRRVKESKKMRNLVDFHSRNKYMFMTYSQVKLRELGRVVSNPEKNEFSTTIENYYERLLTLFSNNPRSSKIVNVATKIYGYFSKNLSQGEKTHFKKQMEGFRAGTVPLASIRDMLKLWAIRFEDEYILQQTFFQPFPTELNDICAYQKY